jgi:hypothetical protein
MSEDLHPDEVEEVLPKRWKWRGQQRQRRHRGSCQPGKPQA